MLCPWASPRARPCSGCGTSSAPCWSSTRGQPSADCPRRYTSPFTPSEGRLVHAALAVLTHGCCLVLSKEQWVNSFLHQNNRHSCLHWPGAALTLMVVLGLFCCHGSQPRGRYVEEILLDFQCGQLNMSFFSAPPRQLWHRDDERHGAVPPLLAQPAARRTSGGAEEE